MKKGISDSLNPTEGTANPIEPESIQEYGKKALNWRVRK